jgi:hypothetical protein
MDAQHVCSIGKMNQSGITICDPKCLFSRIAKKAEIYGRIDFQYYDDRVNQQNVYGGVENLK